MLIDEHAQGMVFHGQGHFLWLRLVLVLRYILGLENVKKPTASKTGRISKCHSTPVVLPVLFELPLTTEGQDPAHQVLFWVLVLVAENQNCFKKRRQIIKNSAAFPLPRGLSQMDRIGAAETGRVGMYLAWLIGSTHVLLVSSFRQSQKKGGRGEASSPVNPKKDSESKSSQRVESGSFTHQK